jgi:2-oxoisovalerate dehydrogenase E1 component beta subunit
MFGGKARVPLTVRTSTGAGLQSAAQHSQSLYWMTAGIPGLKTVIPSNAADAKGLLLAAIRDDDPVVFCEPKSLMFVSSDVPEDDYTVPLGKAAVVREGADLTVLAYGTMVHVALASAEDAQIDAEVIDLRTLLPLDIDTITKSVEKTGRCVIVHEATRTSGFGAELSALVQENCFHHLEAPIERVTGWDTPYPHAFEWDYFPGPKRVVEAMRRAMEA